MDIYHTVYGITKYNCAADFEEPAGAVVHSSQQESGQPPAQHFRHALGGPQIRQLPTQRWRHLDQLLAGFPETKKLERQHR